MMGNLVILGAICTTRRDRLGQNPPSLARTSAIDTSAIIFPTNLLLSAGRWLPFPSRAAWNLNSQITRGQATCANRPTLLTDFLLLHVFLKCVVVVERQRTLINHVATPVPRVVARQESVSSCNPEVLWLTNLQVTIRLLH
jgi:hypothetical protein